MSRRMQRRSNKMFLSPSLLLVGILIAGIAWFTSTVNATSPTSGKPTPTVPPTLTFQRSHTYVEGNPGIQSHSSAALVKTGATFTQQDVIAFFTQHGFYAGPVV